MLLYFYKKYTVMEEFLLKLVILDGISVNSGDLSWEPIINLFDEYKIYDRTDKEQIKERIADADFVLLNKIKITEDIIKSAPKLKYIGIFATGFNIIDLDAAKKYGVTVCNVPDYSTDSVAQHVFAILFEMTSKVSKFNNLVHNGDWASSKDFTITSVPTTEIAGKTIGILGFGNTGRRVSQIAQAFGMNILVYNRTVYKEFENSSLKFVSKEELFKNSDIITLHLPLNDETRNIIDKQSISIMKDGVHIINVARGPEVNEQDVTDAMKNGKLGAFGCDVVSLEPIVENNPLLTCDNIIITPHIAWRTKEARTRLLSIVQANIEAYMNNKPQNVVNP